MVGLLAGGDKVLQGAQAGMNIAGMARSLLDMLKWVCFAPETRLLTPDGWRRIDQFRPGDAVVTAPEDDPAAPPVVRLVEEVFENRLPVVNLHVGGQVVRTTLTHPFYVRGRGWVPTAALQPGDQLRSHDGQRVAEHHTYFVGDEDWGFSVWAHNACWQDRLAGNVADLETHRVNLGFSQKEWQGIFGSAFRGRPWSETAATRLRTSLTNRGLSSAQIDDVMTTALRGTRLADPNAGANIDLLSPARAIHVLDGDATGGGHRFGTGKSGKTEFPAWWSDARIKDAISSAYVNPANSWLQQGGPLSGTVWAGPGSSLPTGVTSTGKPIRFRTDVIIDGVQLRVVAEPGPGNLRLVGGYPLGGGGRGVYTNP